MKRHAKLSLVMFLMVGLMLTGFDADASDQNSSSSSATHGITSFGHSSEFGFIDFNNHMADFTSPGKYSPDSRVRTDASFNDHLNDYGAHPVFAHENPHHEFTEFRRNDFREQNWKYRPVNAVPEPAEYVSLACGLVLLGIVAVRRRPEQDATIA